ncbi:MAG: two-component system response regulator [Candidatus Sericytochromatia bacterium]
MPQVIIADKSDLFRRSLTSVLSREGYAVTTAETGARALSMAREARPEIVILDVDVVDPTGLETLVRLKAEPSLRRLHVVMVSKDTTSAAVSHAFKLGAEGFLMKPIDLNALVKTLAQLHAPQPELNAEVVVAVGETKLTGKLRFIDQYSQVYLDKAEGDQSPVAMGAVGSLTTLSYEVGKETYLQHALLAEENEQGVGLFPVGQAVSSGAPALFRLPVNLKARYLLPGSFVRLADVTQVSADGLWLRGVQGEPPFNAAIQVTLYPFSTGAPNGTGMAGITVKGKVESFTTQPGGLTDVEVSLVEPGGLAYIDLLAELIAGRPVRAAQPQEVAP